MPTNDNSKPFLSYNGQIELLRERGLIIPNDMDALRVLKSINYYRFSAYSLTLRKDDCFYPNVSITDIESLYDFDSDFRKLIFEYSSVAETSARSYMAYYIAEKYGPLGYLNNQNFDSEERHAAFIKTLANNLSRSSDAFVIHHRENKNGVYPVWVAVEETTFGSLSLLYKNMLKNDRAAVAKTYYGIPRKYIENAMQCATVARNISAHGGRFYNRINLKPSVLLPNSMVGISNDRPFAYIYAIFILIPDEQKEHFIQSLHRLFARHPFALPKHLGFPTDWEYRLSHL